MIFLPNPKSSPNMVRIAGFGVFFRSEILIRFVNLTDLKSEFRKGSDLEIETALFPFHEILFLGCPWSSNCHHNGDGQYYDQSWAFYVLCSLDFDIKWPCQIHAP